MAIPLYKDDIIPAQNRAEITTANDDDLLIVSQANVLKKITKANVKESFGINAKASQTDLDTTNTTIDSNLAYTESLHADSITKDKDLQAQVEVARKVASTASVETYNGADIINDTSVSIVGKADDGVIDVSDVVVDGELDLTLKGKTYSNGVKNPQFKDGLAYWSQAYSVNTVDGNILSNTGNGGFSRPYFRATPKIGTLDDLYYISVKALVTNSDAYSIAIDLVGSTDGRIIRVSYKDSPTINQWYVLDVIIQPSTLSGDLILEFYHQYTDATTANGKVMKIQYPSVHNLTQLGLNTTITTTEQAEDYFNFIDGTSSVLPQKITVNETVAKVPTDLKSVPSITDTFDVTTGVHTQNVKKYVLTEDDFVELYTPEPTVDSVRINELENQSIFVSQIGQFIIENYPSKAYEASTDNFNTSYASTVANRLRIVVEKGTYTDLATAKTALAGTVVYYQLATPIITQYEPQPLLVTKGSQIEVESFESKTVPNSDGIITFDYDISSVEHVYRYDTGEEVETTDYTFIDNVLTVNNVIDLIVISADVYLSNSTNPTLVSKVPVENLTSRVEALEALIATLI